MSIPSPTMFATRPVAVPTVIDTRCGATRVVAVGANAHRVSRCGRHGEHTTHVDCLHNDTWSDEER